MATLIVTVGITIALIIVSNIRVAMLLYNAVNQHKPDTDSRINYILKSVYIEILLVLIVNTFFYSSLIGSLLIQYYTIKFINLFVNKS